MAYWCPWFFNDVWHFLTPRVGWYFVINKEGEDHLRRLGMPEKLLENGKFRYNMVWLDAVPCEGYIFFLVGDYGLFHIHLSMIKGVVGDSELSVTYRLKDVENWRE